MGAFLNALGMGGGGEYAGSPAASNAAVNMAVGSSLGNQGVPSQIPIGLSDTAATSAIPMEQGFGFGQYLKELSPWEHLAYALQGDYLGLRGYGNWQAMKYGEMNRQQKEEQAKMLSSTWNAIDKALLDRFGPEDWGDKDIRIQAQRFLTERGVPTDISNAVLDKYYIGDRNIMWYDENTMTLHAHRKDENGNVISGTKRIPVDMGYIQNNGFYRGLYAYKYPKMKPFLEEKAGPIPRDQQMKEQFLKEMQNTGLTGMIQKYGGPDPASAMDVFLTYARGILGFTPAIEDPPKLILQYSEQLKELRDKHDMINRMNAGLKKGEKAIPIDPDEKALIKVFQQEIKRLTKIQRERQGKKEGAPSLDEIFKGGVTIPD